MQRLTLLLFLSELLITAAFPQHTSTRHRRDLQILTPPQIDQSPPLYQPPLSEPYSFAADQHDNPPEFPISSPFLPAPDTTLSTKHRPTILNPEPSVDTTYCTEKKVLVCCPQQNSEKFKIPDDGFLPKDCRLAAQYGVEFGKYPCRCCGGYFGSTDALGGFALGTNCVDATYDAKGTEGSPTEGSGGNSNDGTVDYEGSWD